MSYAASILKVAKDNMKMEQKFPSLYDIIGFEIF